jgi:hypothetical protein
MCKVVGFLQNAWSTSPNHDAGVWERSSWLKALWRSRSGQRLRLLVQATPQMTWFFTNTAVAVGDSPDSVMPPDFAHINKVLYHQHPDVVVTFGNQAANALEPVCLRRGLPLLKVPHPAHRVLTNKLYESAAEMLNRGFEGVAQIKQEKMGVVRIIE